MIYQLQLLGEDHLQSFGVVGIFSTLEKAMAARPHAAPWTEAVFSNRKGAHNYWTSISRSYEILEFEIDEDQLP